MKTGTDISILVCRAEGYAVVDHPAPPHKFNPDKPYLLSISNPAGWTDEGHRKPKVQPGYLYQGMTSYREIWEQFEKGGAEIKSFCDFENCPMPSPDEEPGFGDFVTLAQTVFHYRGLQ